MKEGKPDDERVLRIFGLMMGSAAERDQGMVQAAELTAREMRQLVAMLSSDGEKTSRVMPPKPSGRKTA